MSGPAETSDLWTASQRREAALQQIARNIVTLSKDPGAPLDLFRIETAGLAPGEVARVQEIVDEYPLGFDGDPKETK
jgi:hypothetical protein